MVPIAEMTGVYGFFVFCNVAGRGGVEMHVVLPSKDKTIKREIVDRNRALLKDTTYAIFNAMLKLPLILVFLRKK